MGLRRTDNLRSVANEQEYQRFSVDTLIDEAALHEIYLRPFEMLVKSTTPPGCIMTAYNKVNNLHMDMQTSILQQILKRDWGFRGLVMSDWGGTNSTVGSVLAGCDLEMPGPALQRGQKLLDALAADNNHEVQTAINASCRRLLSCCSQLNSLGLSEKEVKASRARPERSETTAADVQRLRQVASEGHVLLKNTFGTLPLRPYALAGKKIAVIGPNALSCTPGGGGSASMNPQYQSHPFEALRSTLADLNIDVDLKYAAGAVSHKWLPLTSAEQWSTTTDSIQTSAMLRVDFFASDDLTGPIIETQYRNNSSVDLTDSGPACLREASKPYSLRVSSTVTSKTTGMHEFSICSVGHSRLKINGRVLLDNFDWTDAGDAFYAFSSTELRASTHMTAREPYSIVIEAVSKLPDAPTEGDHQPAHVWSMQPSVRLGFLEEHQPSTMIADAVSLAAASDYTILVVGLNAEWESEGYDRTDMALPGTQDELVQAVLEGVYGSEKKVIVVNQSGSPVEMPWADRATTILQAWYGGQEAGNGLVDVLLGTMPPGGRLPLTWPRRYKDAGFERKRERWGGVNGTVRYEEGTAVGYRWFAREGVEPLWWFGHGLSYTEFDVGDVEVCEQGEEGQGWRIGVKVQNVGAERGRHVTQVYSWPREQTRARELRAFEKTEDLQPGQSQSVELVVRKRDMAHWIGGRWTLEAGEYVLGLCENAGAVETFSAVVKVAETMTWDY